MNRKGIFLEFFARRFSKPARITLNSEPRLLSPKAKPLRRRRSATDLPSTLARAALIVTLLCLSFACLSARSGVQEIGPIGLTVGDLKPQLFFYTNTLPFNLAVSIQ